MNLLRPLAAALFLSATAAFAENAPAPVPAAKEKYHKVVFENDYVRMIDVQFKPGQATDYHIHSIASVVVYLTTSTNRSQTWNTETFLNRETTPGNSRYAPYDREPLTHRVTNTGTTLFRVYDIELVRKAPAPAAAAVPPPAGAEIKWDDKLVRASNVRLAPGKSAAFAANACAHLVIGISGTVNTAPRIKIGDYQFIAAGTAFELRNTGNDASEVVLLELR